MNYNNEFADQSIISGIIYCKTYDDMDIFYNDIRSKSNFSISGMESFINITEHKNVSLSGHKLIKFE